MSLGEICELCYGKSLKSSDRAGGDVLVYGSNGAIGYHDVALTRGRTIVVGRKGSFGEVHLSDGSCWPIDTTYYIDESATECDLVWLSYALRQLDLKELNRAAAVPGLNRDDAYRRMLLLPPLEEQRRIARVLNAVKAIRNDRSMTIDLLGRLQNSLLETWLHNDVDDMELVTVGAVTSLVTKGTTPTSVGFPYVEEGIRFLRAQDLVGGTVMPRDDALFISPTADETLRRSRIAPGDVLLSIAGTIGRVAVVPDNAGTMNCNQAVAILRCTDALRPRFLRAALALASVRRQISSAAVTATIANLSLGQIRGLRIPLPQPSVQRMFESRSNAVERQVERSIRHLRHLEALSASLEYRAFAGGL